MCIDGQMAYAFPDPPACSDLSLLSPGGTCGLYKLPGTYAYLACYNTLLEALLKHFRVWMGNICHMPWQNINMFRRVFGEKYFFL